MSPPRIRHYLERRPFVPFTVHTGDGTAVRVRSPESAQLAPGGRTLFVWTGETVAEGFEDVQVIDVFLITKLHLLEPPTPPTHDADQSAAAPQA